MKAVIAKDFSEGGTALRVIEVGTPRLEDGEVLIDVECSTIHPADAMMVEGHYPRGAIPPFRVGLSGVGRVRASQKAGLLGQLIKNKRVVFAFPELKFGAWAEQITTLPTLCAPIPENLPSESAVNLLTNGATAIGLAETLGPHSKNGMVVTAAAGDLGRLLRCQTKKQYKAAVCVVRSEEQVKKLQAEGEKYVLNLNDNRFEEKLAELTARLDISAAVDSIAGPMPEWLVRALPLHSKILCVGRLSGRALTIDAMNVLIAKGGIIQGFNVGHWISAKSTISAMVAIRRATKLLHECPPPPARFRWSLEEVVERFSEGTIGTSAGKVIVVT